MCFSSLVFFFIYLIRLRDFLILNVKFIESQMLNKTFFQYILMPNTHTHKHKHMQPFTYYSIHLQKEQETVTATAVTAIYF